MSSPRYCHCWQSRSPFTLYVLFGGDGFRRRAIQPRDEICKQDGDRLAQLQAKPSLDEAVRFGSELRCLKLWPQLQAILDSLSHTAGSTAVSSLERDRCAPTVLPASRDGGRVVAGHGSESATSDDACKHDEDRFAELQAKPSIDKAMRFGSELRCSKLRPQLLAILDRLGHAVDSAGYRTTLRRTPASTEPAAAASPATEPRSSATDDACKHDQDRLDELQAKPFIDGAIRFDSELRCARLQPQLPAMLKAHERRRSFGQRVAPRLRGFHEGSRRPDERDERTPARLRSDRRRRSPHCGARARKGRPSRKSGPARA